MSFPALFSYVGRLDDLLARVVAQRSDTLTHHGLRSFLRAVCVLVHPDAGHPDREASLSLLFLRAPKAPPPGLAHTEEIIRSELFSVERLEQHGETLAVAQRVTDRPGRGAPMAPRVRENGRVLLDAYRSIEIGRAHV